MNTWLPDRFCKAIVCGLSRTYLVPADQDPERLRELLGPLPVGLIRPFTKYEPVRGEVFGWPGPERVPSIVHDRRVKAVDLWRRADRVLFDEAAQRRSVLSVARASRVGLTQRAMKVVAHAMYHGELPAILRVPWTRTKAEALVHGTRPTPPRVALWKLMAEYEDAGL